MIARKRMIALVPLTLLAPLGGADGAPGIPVTVSSFSSEKTCTMYELQWGRDFAHADDWSVTIAREWGSQLVRDCQQNFPGLRTTIAAAFASAGGPGALRGRRLILSGRLTDVGFQTNAIATGSSAVTAQSMVVSVDFVVKDGSGQVVYGGALTKHFPIGATTETDTVSYGEAQSGRTTYSQLQREVAYAVARAVTFHLAPLRVTANDGHRIQLNYGTPFVPLGAAILVPHGGSLRTSRVNVSASTDTGAIAESQAGVDLGDVAVGAMATFAEADDPAANGRVYERVELPEN